MEEKKQNKFIFIIEHLEEFLYDWCLAEYKQVMQYLNTTKFYLVFTNYNRILNYKGEFDQKNQENIKKFMEYNKQYFNDEIILINKPILECIDNKKQSIVFENGLEIKLSLVCLLDMKGKKYLEPADSSLYTAFIFGGILGDNPPKVALDRTKCLRNENFSYRHLGEIQMSTDTAILVSKLILANQLKFEEIPVIDHPEITEKVLLIINSEGIQVSFSLDGFRYVSKSLDIETSQKLENPQKNIYMSDEIKNNMIFEDLDISKM